MESGHKFAFICGLHRSGTSILHEALRTHPEISGFINTGVPEDEGQHLQSIFAPARAFGGPGKFGFDPLASMTESHPLVTDQNRDLLFQQWSRYWDLSKPILIEKSPPTIIRSRFMQAMFPNSYFIMITRHPIAVSFATQKWAKTSISELFRHWIVVHDNFARDKPYLTNLCMLSYEQLIYHPRETLDRIGQFLGISIQSTFPFADHNQAYFMKWKSSGLSKSIDRYWKTFRYEQEFSGFGYSVKNTLRYPVFQGFSQQTRHNIG